jgi:hypothetical protein
MAIPGALISGFAIYFIFSYLFMPVNITVPISIIIFFLIFGLTKYYTVDRNSKTNDSIKTTTDNYAYISKEGDDDSSNIINKSNSKNTNNTNESSSSSGRHIPLASIIFVLGYITALSIVAIDSLFSSLGISGPNLEVSKLFIPWHQQFNTVSIVKLGAAIALSFFLPGYALVSSFLLKEEKFEVITRNGNSDESRSPYSLSKFQVKLQQLQPRRSPLLKGLLGYIFSIFITGVVGHIVASFGIPVSGISIILPIFFVYLIILIVYILRARIISLPAPSSLNRKSFGFNLKSVALSTLLSLLGKIKRKNDEHDDDSTNYWAILVFASLFALVILSTYYLYGGIIIGDQWYHHGRALKFLYGTFKDNASLDQEDWEYGAPFLSSVLAVFFTLANIPSVNAYASISFLNMIPVFAFYYFFTSWVPNNWRRAALLASALFILSAGFGWVSVLYNYNHTDSTDQLTKYQNSVLEIIHREAIKSFDIVFPSTFVISAHPEYSTALIIIVLPLGFVLFGLLKESVTQSKIKYFFIFTGISIAGLFSHDEYYLFIIIASILPIIFRLPSKSLIYLSFLFAISIAFFSQMLLFPGKYLTVISLFGVPILALSFFFVALTWALYIIAGFSMSHRVKQGGSILIKTWFSNRSIRFGLKLALIGAVAYFYIFTFILWSEIPLKDLVLQTSQAFESVVPWYMYPMKLGVTGLVGLAFVLSYLFKKFQKEVFVFGVIALIAFFAGPYYDEHRFSKYIMVGMVGFASLLIYQIITRIVATTQRAPAPSTSTTKISPSSSTSEIVANYNHNLNTKLMQSSSKLKTLICGLVIASVITLSSLSVLLFVGYHASALEVHNFDLALGRRDFPSYSEINMFRLINSNNSKSFYNISNVAIMPNQYQIHQGLVGKLQGFTTIPLSVLVKTPLALNASTLEGFYYLLNQSNTRYIIVPTNAFNDSAVGVGGIEPRGPSNVLQFTLKNFQRMYQDKNYILLAVPSSTLPPTSSAADVALVYQKRSEAYSASSPSNDTTDRNSNNNNSSSRSKTLLYNNESFDKIDSSKFIKVDKDKKTAIFYGNKSQTLWSKLIPSRGESISYLQGTFRILQENHANVNNDCGLTWDDGIKKYYVRFTKDKLQFSQTPLRSAFLLQDQGTIREKSIWYKIKVGFLSTHTIDIYLDDVLKLQVSKDRLLSSQYNNSDYGAVSNSSSYNHITKLGIRCSGNGTTGEFEPLQVGLLQGGDTLSARGHYHENNGSNYYYNNTIYKKSEDNYYYPLNMFALSKTAYDTFLDDDFSVFSKRKIILTFDPSDEYKIGRYLEFVEGGGTLIIINTDNNFNGGFSKLLGISQTDNTTEFDKIVGKAQIQNREQESSLKISGITKDIRFQVSPDVKVLSSYESNSDRTNAPFAIEKDYQVGDRKGRIIFVNAAAYFEAISKSPGRYFSSLSTIPHLIGLPAEKDASTTFNNPPDSLITARYIGNLTVSGRTMINSTSFSFFDPSTVGFYDFITQGASVSSIQQPQKKKNIEGDNDKNNNNNATGLNDNKKRQQLQQQHLQYINRDSSENIQIKDFKVSGPYKVIINSTGQVYLPSWSSYHDYISVSIPTGFNMTLQLLQGSAAEFTARAIGGVVVGGGAAGGGNYTRHLTITAANGSNNLIEFHSIRTNYPEIKSIPILMKSPEIAVNGNATFALLYQSVTDFDNTYGIKGVPVKVNGKLSAQIDHIDHYDTSGKRSYSKNYLTYFKWLKTYGSNIESPYQPIYFGIPGDISPSAKVAKSQVPWQSAAGSNASILVAISLFIIMAIALRLFWPKMKKEIRL